MNAKRIPAILLLVVFTCGIFNACAEERAGITFSGLPWLITRGTAESALGLPFGVNMDKVILIDPDAVTDRPGIGFQAYYRDAELAGYEASCTISYVYPVMDGVLVRDDDLALMYIAQYRIWPEDADAAAEDLTAKLSGLYGEPIPRDIGSDELNQLPVIWMDDEGNAVRMEHAENAPSITVYFCSGEMAKLVNEASEAAIREQQGQEESK